MTQIARKFNKVISLGVKFPICKLNQSIFRVTVDLSSVRYAQAFGTVENTFEAPIRRRPLRDCDHSWQRPQR